MIAPQPFFRARGTPFSILHRIRALLEAGHKVDLVTYPFGDNVLLPGLRIIRSARPPLIRDVKIGPSVAKVLLDIPLYFKAKKMLRERCYDVLHSHEEAAFFAVGLARTYRLHHIYDMHSSLPQQLQNFRAFNFGPVRALFKALEKWVLRTCDGVISICAELEQIALNDCGSTPQAMIENTGDDTKIFGKSSEDLRTDLELHNRQIILYTGTLEPYQGIDLLLKSFTQVLMVNPQAHLLLVGGRPEQVVHYQTLAQSLNISDAVTFVGMVHPLRIPTFLETTDILVSPRSSGTNTPLKIYGYMRSRRPLVATDLLTHTQTLDSGIAYLVPPTIEGLAEGMNRLLGDPALGKRLANAALRRAERDFSDAAYIEKVNDFYQRVLRSNTRVAFS